MQEESIVLLPDLCKIPEENINMNRNRDHQEMKILIMIMMMMMIQDHHQQNMNYSSTFQPTNSNDTLQMTRTSSINDEALRCHSSNTNSNSDLLNSLTAIGHIQKHNDEPNINVNSNDKSTPARPSFIEMFNTK